MINVGKLNVSERYARETGREAIGKGLLLFPVSRSTENLPLVAFLRAKAKNS